MNEAIRMPDESKIVSKYLVRNELKTNVGSWGECGRDRVPFLQMSENDCQFHISNSEYRIWEKYNLNENGKVKAYWNYKYPEGPVSYNIDELRKDKRLSELVGVNKIQIRYLKKENKIFDSGNVLKIEKIFESEKLIFVGRNSSVDKEGFKTIFQYKEF